MDTAAQVNRELLVPDIGPGTRPAERPKVEGHWGEEAVGFGWEESDSIDGRWSQTEIGPFLASVLQTPKGIIAKGLSIRLDANGGVQGSVAYDTATMTCRVAWTNGFLKFDPARYGVIKAPQMHGDAFVVQNRNAWGDAKVRYRGLFQHGRSVVLQYDVDGSRVREAPRLIHRDGKVVLQRDFEVASSEQELALRLSRYTTVVSQAGIVFQDGDDPQVRIPGRRGGVRSVRFTTYSGADEELKNVTLPTSQVDIGQISLPGERLWPELLHTVGIVSTDDGPLVVDTVTVPTKNPYQALMFVSGHDFFGDGRAAVCTLHGDVWLVDGLDATLENVTWKRFATGLHQPLGLRIVDDNVFVLGRDQITRLHDRDENGEADYYECFNNDGQTSIGGHDYAAGLETDRDGNFYYVRANVGVVKVAADGTSEEIIAAGLRNPAGLAVSDSGRIATSPQEGEWTPSSAVFNVRPNDWFGYGGPKVTPRRPLGYDPPICWIPRRVDNSTGGQVWVSSDSWAPLRDQLLTLSFGRCALLLTLRDDVEGVMQGASVPLELSFDSGLMRGRFHPHDGQLYVSGLKGWLSSAIRDGCFQRVRYTGQPLNLPTQFKVYANGLAITFSDPLDATTAGIPDNFRLQQWDYRYSSEYGSAEYRPSDPKQPGREDVELASSWLSDDDRTVFLEIEDLQPVMQLQVSYALRSRDGRPIQNSIYGTINVVPKRMINSKPRLVAGAEKPGRLDREVRKRLQPGLVARFRQQSPTGTTFDTRRSPHAALLVRSEEAVTSQLDAGAFDFSMSGYLRSRLKGDVRFWIEGPSGVVVTINGDDVQTGRLTAEEVPLSEEPIGVNLARGYNRIEIHGLSSGESDYRFRLFWSSDAILPEPIPITAISHDSRNPELEEADARRDSRLQFAALRCIRCHAVPRVPALGVTSEETGHAWMPDLFVDAPRLVDLGQRLDTDWLAHWLFAPRRMRSQASMPHVLADSEQGRAEAIHLAAYLTANSATHKNETLTADWETQDQRIDLGLELYETLGCMACHRFTPPEEEDKFDRISLHFAAAKFQPQQLASFLQSPNKHYEAIRMPDFGLDPTQAVAIAAYVRSQSRGKLPRLADVVANPVVGEKLFQERSCHQCHSMEKGKQLPPPPFGTLFHAANQRGCLAESATHRGTAPDFGFDQAKRSGLLSFLRGSDKTLRRNVLSEIAMRTMKRLRCDACHDQDANYSSLPDIMSNESELGFAYERLPNLGAAGEKLRVDWLERQIGGLLAYRSRPWLKMRMPAFPFYARWIPPGMAAAHGLTSESRPKKVATDDLIAIGKSLASKEKGFDCVQCHALDDKFLQLENKANGIGLAYVTDRLRKEYYHRWIRDPLRIDPLTKMPKFSPDGVTSQRTEFFGGDAKKQFEALWSYMRALDSQREKGSLGDASDFIHPP